MPRRRREAVYVCEGCDSRVYDDPTEAPPGWSRAWIGEAMRLLCGCCASEVLYGPDPRVPRWVSDRMRERLVEWARSDPAETERENGETN